MRSRLGASRRVVAGLPPAGRGRRIGLLGGSFNPAHGGHLQISLTARARLGLDAVWWLVSPQNPLKPQEGMAPLETRIESARRLARPAFIRVTGIEAEIGARYAVETVEYLTARFADTHFVWIMGADNLAIFHRWNCWREIAAAMPIAVIDRPGEGLAALASRAAVSLARFRLDEADAGALATASPPGWVMLHGRLSPLSSTAIRAAR